MRFLNVTGSPSTNAMFGIEAPEGRTPFQGGSLWAEAPDFAKPTSRLAFRRHLPQHEGRHSFSNGAWAILLDRSAVEGRTSDPAVRRRRPLKGRALFSPVSSEICT
jgi:hypothetical protein